MLISDTKQSLSSRSTVEPREIQRLVKRAWPKALVLKIKPLAYAFTNKTFLLELEGGPERVVLKISAQPDRYDRLRSEVSLIKRLTTETSLPLPEILYEDLSGREFVHPFVFYSFLPGTNLVDAIDNIKSLPRLGQELARVALEIHKIKFPEAQFSLGQPEKETNWRNLINEKIERGLQKLAEAEYPKLTKLKGYLKEARPLLSEPENYSLVHRDFQAQNIHWDEKSQKIVGLFDFESAMSGDHHFEFNFLERYLFRAYPEVANTFYPTYAKGGKLQENFRELVRFYGVVRDLYFFVRDIEYREFDRSQKALESIEKLVFGDFKQ